MTGPQITGAQIAIEQVRVGDTLPDLEIPLTRTLIVAGAIATRDYEDVHHDPAQAQRRGTPDTFMSINNTNGLVGRYVTDWAGPAARMVRLSTRLGVPNFPGDTMRLTGEVVAVEADTVRVAVRGLNSKGAHAISEVTVRLPPRRDSEGASQRAPASEERTERGAPSGEPSGAPSGNQNGALT